MSFTSSPRDSTPTRARPGIRGSLSQALRNVRQRAQTHTQAQAPAGSPPQRVPQEDSQEAFWKKMRSYESQGAGPEIEKQKTNIGCSIQVDVYPEHIEAQEIYFYQIEVSDRSQVHLADDPRGEIRLQVPYDGFEYFTLDAAHTLKEQLVDVGPGPVNGQIGWLAICPPLDWEHDWSRPAGADTVPVYISLRSENLVRDEQWTADEVRAIVQYNYIPDDLPFWPVSIEMHVYDDAAVPVENLRDYLDLLARPKETQDGEEQLVIDLIVTAFIPTVLCTEHPAAAVRIELLKLAWPTIAMPWQVQIYQNTGHGDALSYDQPVAWRYNPDLGTVEVYNVLARRDEPETGSPLTPHHCELRLVLRGASQVICQEELLGAVRLRVEEVLLSGCEATWLAASGPQAASSNTSVLSRLLAAFRSKTSACQPEKCQAVRRHTLLQAGFVAGWRERLEHRRRATYRRWRFPGVGLSLDRLADIAAALRDLGYQVQKQTLEEDGASGLLTATRMATLPTCLPEEPQEWQGHIISRAAPHAASERARLRLVIVAERTAPIRIRRERETPEGVRISAEIETNDLILHARGHTQGLANIIARDMEQLMVMLKKRFAVAADL
jgi:hypothetical protein